MSPRPARDTLGAAAGIAQQLPSAIGAELLDVARTAFVQGMQVAAAISVVVAVAVAVLALFALRNVQAGGEGGEGSDAEREDAEPREPVRGAALTAVAADCA